MNGLLVYGSLINNNEIKSKHFDLYNRLPVFVHGFKREFSQEPSWRRSSGRDRAVLTVIPDKDYHINAILFQDVPLKVFPLIDERERGYNRVEVNHKNVLTYQNFERPIECNTIYIYTGKPEKRNCELFPNPDYLSICINGAKEWGATFYDDFLNTTFIGNQTLKNFINTTIPS
ncbi:Gamma-glutamylcyclotransferase [Candidatus Magnetomoraceae bacterium gMMP-13]